MPAGIEELRNCAMSTVPATTAPATTFVNIAAYKFTPLDRLDQRRRALKSRCVELDLKGTILLSPEGINLFIAGRRAAIDALLAELRSEPPLAELAVKESLSEHQPFNRMLVRLKKEIIAFGVEGIRPGDTTSPKISPAELKQWLDEGRPVTLLDTRNDYEIKLGTFAGAVDLRIGHFRDFPRAVRELPETMKRQPIVMFCTGGIRCEKASPFMQREGFEHVLQLDGGILKYFEEVGGDHWRGECFVFDQRVSVDPHLAETSTTECFACKATLTEQDQQSEKFVPGESCPYCWRSPEQHMAEAICRRHARLREISDPLPGSVPYDNQRPINVPLKYDRATLLEFLDGLHPHVGRGQWQQWCDDGRIVHRGRPAAADQQVRAGERYCHLLPTTIEPPVNAAIEILYEDEWLVVVNKPAPLPLHPCGRFNRNTLMHLLHQVYAPLRLRPAHRLDANTSGLVVLSRTRAVARRVQPLFESRQIEKVYLARVHGRPERDELTCETKISESTTQAGLRLPDSEGLEAITQFRLVQRFADNTSLLEVRPVTGRTNQIRVHLWDLGLPIVGDPSYRPQGELGGSQTLAPGEPPLCLHAWQLTLPHPQDHAPRHFTAPAPSWAK